MYRYDESMHKHHELMHNNHKYAHAYILPQNYEDLFSCKEGFTKGTLFKVLFDPYDENKNTKC